MSEKAVAGTTIFMLLLPAAAANAADMVPPAADWTGFYAGLHGGVEFGLDSSIEASAESRIPPLPPSPSAQPSSPQEPRPPSPKPVDVFANTQRDSSSGDASFIGGINLGYNYQSGAMVFGAEADISGIADGKQDLEAAAGVEGGGPVCALDTVCAAQLDGYGFDTSATGEFGITGLATLRARLGYDIDGRWLPFITGGLAWGRLSTEGTVTYSESDGHGGTPMSVTRDFGDTSWEMGWTAGAGVNYRLSDNAFLGLTYLYTDLGTHDVSDAFDAGKMGPFSGSMEGEIDARFHSVRLSFDVLF